MNNKDRLLSDLRNLQCDRLSVQIMHDDIARISADLECVAQSTATELSAHPANPDVVSLQEERSRLLTALQLTVNHVSRLERLLQMLSPEEQLVINCMLINPYKKCTMDLMAELAKGLAEQADKLAGEGTVTVQTDDRGGKELQIKLGNDVPETVNTALNLFYQFIAKRYFNTDYDRINERYMVPMANYLTVTEGILSTTKSVTLRQADLTAKLDSAGKLEQVTGEMTVCFHTGRDGERELSISFRLNVSDEGSSKVEYFDPAAIQ